MQVPKTPRAEVVPKTPRAEVAATEPETLSCVCESY
jgi:hypothetical protein